MSVRKPDAFSVECQPATGQIYSDQPIAMNIFTEPMKTRSGPDCLAAYKDPGGSVHQDDMPWPPGSTAPSAAYSEERSKHSIAQRSLSQLVISHDDFYYQTTSDKWLKDPPCQWNADILATRTMFTTRKTQMTRPPVSYGACDDPAIRGCGSCFKTQQADDCCLESERDS
jgi:hypothetical protein